jgi:hypothetical protein
MESMASVAPGDRLQGTFSALSVLRSGNIQCTWPRGTGFPQLPSAVISTVDHFVGSSSLPRYDVDDAGAAGAGAAYCDDLRLLLSFQAHTVEEELRLEDGSGMAFDRDPPLESKYEEALLISFYSASAHRRGGGRRCVSWV